MLSNAQDIHSNHIVDSWGYCLAEDEELVPRSRQTFGVGHKCTDNYHHTCSAQANYGGITVDWENRTILLSLFTPHEAEIVASSIEIDF